MVYENQIVGGERPYYRLTDAQLRHVRVTDGESAVKECRHLVVEHSEFLGKYPFWETRGLVIRQCHLADSARAALWYCEDVEISDSVVDAPKCFREVQRIKASHLTFPYAEETFWQCAHLQLEHSELENADYYLMHSHDCHLDHIKVMGNYAFQYVHHIEIHHAVLTGRDSFWESDNCTIYDSELTGAYIGWYSRNLHLVRCHISGTQPLCYAQNLILEDCTFGDDADRAFEYSDVQATIVGAIPSIVNPQSGTIVVDRVGEVISNDYHCAIHGRNQK